jgi:hypothetical protein
VAAGYEKIEISTNRLWKPHKYDNKYKVQAPPPPPAVVVLKKNRLNRMLNDNNCTGTIPPKNLAVLIKNRNIPNKKTTP